MRVLLKFTHRRSCRCYDLWCDYRYQYRGGRVAIIQPAGWSRCRRYHANSCSAKWHLGPGPIGLQLGFLMARSKVLAASSDRPQATVAPTPCSMPAGMPGLYSLNISAATLGATYGTVKFHLRQ